MFNLYQLPEAAVSIAFRRTGYRNTITGDEYVGPFGSPLPFGAPATATQQSGVGVQGQDVSIAFRRTGYRNARTIPRCSVRRRVSIAFRRTGYCNLHVLIMPIGKLWSPLPFGAPATATQSIRYAVDHLDDVSIAFRRTGYCNLSH